MTAPMLAAGPIDAHAHLVPASVQAHLERPDLITVHDEGERVRLELRGRTLSFPRSLVDPAALVAAAREREVGVSVASLPPFAFAYELEDDAPRWSAAFNDAFAEAQDASGGHLVGVATLPMRDVASATAEVRRAAGLGLRAVAIATHPDRWIDDPVLDPVWRAIADAGMAVLLHPHQVDGRYGEETHHLRNTVGNPLETSYAQARLVFSDWRRRHPTVRVALSHGGGALTALVGRWRHAADHRDGVALSDPAWLRAFYYDTIVFDDDVLRALVRLVGADRVLFGSDAPFDMADPRTAVNGLALLPEEDAAQVARSSALSWLFGPDAASPKGG